MQESKTLKAARDPFAPLPTETYLPFLMNKRGKILPTIENLQILLDHHNVLCRYNVISKKNEIKIPSETYTTDNGDNCSMAWIASAMSSIELPTVHYRDYLQVLADRHMYNPIVEWIGSKAWDGHSRLPEFFRTIEAEHEIAKEAFLYRWLLGAIACIFNPDGADAPGIIVLQGNQNLGKTWWVRKLVPEINLPEAIRTGANINPHDKDSLSQAIAYWIVEIGELDATFRRSDIAALKAFLTNSRDTFRRPYAPMDSNYPRRTAFAATVNEWNYLNDPTGNRRFWTIACRKVDSYHKIDMQQLWAEIYEKYRQGESWQLTESERSMVNEINAEHEITDPITEKIQEFYSWETYPHNCIWKTCQEILNEIGILKPTLADSRCCSRAVRSLNNNQAKIGGKAMKLAIPPRSSG